MALTKAHARKNPTARIPTPSPCQSPSRSPRPNPPKVYPFKSTFIYFLSSSFETNRPPISLAPITIILPPFFQCILQKQKSSTATSLEKPQKTQSENPPYKRRSMRIMAGVGTSKQSKSMDTTICTIFGDKSCSPPPLKCHVPYSALTPKSLKSSTPRRKTSTLTPKSSKPSTSPSK